MWTHTREESTSVHDFLSLFYFMDALSQCVPGAKEFRRTGGTVDYEPPCER